MTSLTRKAQTVTSFHELVSVEAVREQLAALPDPAVLTDSSGVIITSNSSWEEMLQEVSPTGRQGDSMITEVFSEYLDAAGQTLLTTVRGQLSSSRLLIEDLELALEIDGRVSTRRVRVSPVLDRQAVIIAAVWTFQDVSAERQARNRSRHHDKMKAISRLAAGVAHEFNNLLTAVLGNLEIMRAKAGDSLGGHLDAAEAASVRATRLIQELRHFGTRSLPGLKPQSVRPVLDKSVQILEGMCPPGVTVTCRLESDSTLSARIDADVLQDVILRVGRNSLEALPATGGSIRLLADVQRTEEFGTAVRIQVVDNGPGLEPTVHEMAFEPFFTTRSPDSNSGLGLAIVYGLVEEMGGSVEIESREYGGTTVTMLLPWADLPQEAEPPAPRTIPKRTLQVGLVDNEQGVRAVGQGMLKLIGHEVTTFPGGQNLLDSLADGLQLDVILLDSAMPGLSGRETYCRIRQSGCTTPVIICSGTSVELSSFCPRQSDPPQGFLAKPFTLAALAEAVEAARRSGDSAER